MSGIWILCFNIWGRIARDPSSSLPPSFLLQILAETRSPKGETKCGQNADRVRPECGQSADRVRTECVPQMTLRVVWLGCSFWNFLFSVL